MRIKRPLILKEDHAIVPLTRGYFAIIDLCDVGRVQLHNWSAQGCAPGSIYASGWIGGRNVTLHRFLVGEPGLHVDHKDGDTLNCRRSNLRCATRQQNMYNRWRRTTSRNNYKGVKKDCAGFSAYINVLGAATRLGSHGTEEAAARAYDEAARKYHGEFARLNFPAEGEQPA